MAEQPRREDSRVVHDEQVATTEMSRQLIECRVLSSARGAIDDDEPGCTAFGGRMSRDQLLRKIEVEVADVHDPKKRARLVRPRLPRMGFHRSPTLAIR